MKKLLLVGALSMAALGLSLGGCDTMGMDHGKMHENMWAGVTKAVAVLQPTQGNTVAGTIWFDSVADGVRVHGDVTGLAAGSSHGFHIHEFGDASSANGSAAGGHYNPEGHTHGGPTDAQHHAGDLGNITADASGKATVDVTIKGISIAGMMDPIIGRGVVVHANKDDFTSPPAPATPGNSGPRIAVGVIGVAKP